MIEHPWVDNREAPLFILRYPASGSYEENVSLYNAAEAFYAGNSEFFAWVIDASAVTDSQAKERKVVADHLNRCKEHFRAYCAGMSLVITSRLIRGVLKAIYWVSPPAYPHGVFASFDEAYRWSNEHLQKVHGSRG